MKLLITGAKGFIGKNLVIEATKRQFDFNTYDPLEPSGELKPSELNLDDITHVIHLGAISSTTETDVKKIIDNNLTWSIELFERCVERGIHFQWSSSASVYGKRSEEQGPFNVTDECKPANFYAMSKFLLEQYIIKRNADIKFQGFRYFNVYGPYEEHKGTQASPHTQFANQAKKTGVIKVFEKSENIYRDFIHVDRVINNHFDMLCSKTNAGIFNVGTGLPRTFMDVARDVAIAYSAEIQTIPFPKHLKDHYQYYTCAG
jgi:ADP-L-glycero-D-manno-heptose 6-epimerase